MNTLTKTIKTALEPFTVIAENIWRCGILPNILYLNYVIRHKWFVLIACYRLAVKYRDPRLVWRGLVHDFSKFRPSEWFAYVNYFNRTFPSVSSDEVRLAWRLGFSPKTKEDVLEAFDKAWNYHQKRNDHHWQYWVLRNDSGSERVLQMPTVCLLEMIADWRGAGRSAKKPDTRAWYLANQDKMMLHELTRYLVESELEI